MTVYLYKMEGQRAKAFTQSYPFPWYGLTADTADELHPFAEALGFPRRFYRPLHAAGEETPLVGHYELDQAEHDRAVTNGARLISTHERKKMLQQRAAELGITLDR
jgi:Protein of unknown function (DUF4031)